MLKLNKVLMII